MRRSARLQEKKTRLAELHLQVTRGRDDTKRGAQKSKLYTIGHSTRAGDKFVELLQAHGIALLADIRTAPGSRRYPQFNQAALSGKLLGAGIQYIHLKELGGFRKPETGNLTNAAWQHPQFRGYADYMQTPAFQAAIEQLVALASKTTVCLMCAEGNPGSCHRRLVADALTVRGVQVLHISSLQPARLHYLTPFAKLEDRLRITYPLEKPNQS